MISSSIQEISLGDKAQFTKTITETDIAFYCAITGDFNPKHVDKTYAESTSIGRMIAPNGIAAGLMAPILGMYLPGLGTLALESWTFPLKTIFPGDTITCSGEIVEKNEQKNIVVIEFTWTNQNGVVVITGGAKVMPPKRD